MNEAVNILELKGITKRFPGVVALDNVDLDVRQGEVHILVGENGAGKSSLVKVLSGVYAADEGTILFQGAPFAPQTPLDAIRAGVQVVYQEFNLLTYLSVAENIYFEHLPQRGGLVDYRRLYADTSAVLQEVGLAVAPQTKVELLGVAQMQQVEIGKALSRASKVLILDEPTATLTPKEIARLFDIIARLKEKGVTIIYISHRLQETFEIGDRITVLRNGRKVATCAIADVTVPEIVRMMVGREMGAEYPFDATVTPGEELFRVEELAYKGSPAAVSFGVRRSELLGIAGLVGSGRTETMRALFGADPKTSGKIFLAGREIAIRRPKDAVEQGICLLTEDRKREGLILDMPVYVNITLTDLAAVARGGLLMRQAERAGAGHLVDELAIKTPSLTKWARYLSGGNQQKVVLAKWLFRQPQVFIFDEPTRGIDVGAKREIYELLWRLAADGKAIIIVSSDLPELLGICHRIIVFSNHRISGEVARVDFSQERILELAYRNYLNGASRAGGEEV
jgi:ribose transport system ATP-binding protein